MEILTGYDCPSASLEHVVLVPSVPGINDEGVKLSFAMSKVVTGNPSLVVAVVEVVVYSEPSEKRNASCRKERIQRLVSVLIMTTSMSIRSIIISDGRLHISSNL